MSVNSLLVVEALLAEFVLAFADRRMRGRLIAHGLRLVKSCVGTYNTVVMISI